MEILMIILLIILILINGLTLYLNYINEHKTVKPEGKKQKLTREEKDKQEQIKKSFDNLMNYDEKIARSRK